MSTDLPITKEQVRGIDDSMQSNDIMEELLSKDVHYFNKDKRKLYTLSDIFIKEVENNSQRKIKNIRAQDNHEEWNYFVEIKMLFRL